jgi:tRNA dimethylallyltransferase
MPSSTFTPKPLEAISADSMQVYTSLPIATNHPPPSDLAEVKHHLLGFFPPEAEFTVVEFVEKSAEIIEGLRKRGEKGVIVVGGTGYYVSSLLWQGTLTPGNKVPVDSDSASEGEDKTFAEETANVADLAKDTVPDDTGDRPEVADSTDLHIRIRTALSAPGTSSSDLHSLLTLADPAIAAVRHPNDARRVRRSLEVFLSSGRQSDLWAAQQEARVGVKSTLRYRSVLFWCWSSPETLDPRLDSRVDTMLERGMLGELNGMREVLEQAQLPGSKKNADGKVEVDWTRGVAQAIGFKEFSGYLGFSSDDVDSGAEAGSEEALAQGIEATKQRTRKYARTQQQWLRNKLVPGLLGESVVGFGESRKRAGEAHAIDVDATSWDNVVASAANVVVAFSTALPVPEPVSASGTLAELLPPAPKPSNPLERTQHHCDICTDHLGQPRLLMDDREWEAHLTSRGHKAAVKRRREMDENPIFKAKAEEAMKKRVELAREKEQGRSVS